MESYCWVFASSLAARKEPEGTQEREVCPVGIALLLCGGCHHYEVMMSFLLGACRPDILFFVRICSLLSSIKLGRTLFKWARFTRSAIEKIKSF